jgi:hypothetical protein
MTPSTTQIAVLPDTNDEDDIIDGSLNLTLSLRNADNELIEMVDTINVNPDGGEEISPYSLSVDWYATVPEADGPSAIVYQPIADSKQWSVEIPINQNEYGYMGIAKATVSF